MKLSRFFFDQHQRLQHKNDEFDMFFITQDNDNGCKWSQWKNFEIFKLKTYWFEKHIGNSDFITFGVLSSWAFTIVCPICPISPVNNVPIFDQNDKIFILSIFFRLWFQFLSLWILLTRSQFLNSFSISELVYFSRQHRPKHTRRLQSQYLWIRICSFLKNIWISLLPRSLAPT